MDIEKFFIQFWPFSIFETKNMILWKSRILNKIWTILPCYKFSKEGGVYLDDTFLGTCRLAMSYS